MVLISALLSSRDAVWDEDENEYLDFWEAMDFKPGHNPPVRRYLKSEAMPNMLAALNR